LAAVADPSELRRRIARLLGEPVKPALRLTRAGALAVILLAGIAALSPVLVQRGTAQVAHQSEDEQQAPPQQTAPKQSPAPKPADEEVTV